MFAVDIYGLPTVVLTSPGSDDAVLLGQSVPQNWGSAQEFRLMSKAMNSTPAWLSLAQQEGLKDEVLRCHPALMEVVAVLSPWNVHRGH